MIEETPGITRLIDRLEGKDLVTRERCKTDRRQVFCRISKGGLDLLDAIDEPVSAAGNHALSALHKREIQDLIALLDKARESLHASIASRRTINNAIPSRRSRGVQPRN
jgi:DNA-binding MarR family transcriptional regulator